MHEHPESEPVPTFNVFDTILKLRCNRVGMVQTKVGPAVCVVSFLLVLTNQKDQFEFCYRAILEEYLAHMKRRKDALCASE